MPYTPPSPIAIKEFQQHIFSWYKANKRTLPWRDCQNPYYVLVSEFMLQQTQVNRVVDKFLAFVKKLPTIEDLSNCSQTTLLWLRSWLWFNRRALNLQKAAQIICKEYKGQVPEDPLILLSLPGIWQYTSCSIPAFAYNKNVAVVDINIQRVLTTRFFGENTTEKLSPRDIQELASQCIPPWKSSDRHNALMDYWSLVMTAKKTGIRSAKQSTFHGSFRQVRGNILKILISAWPQDIEILRKSFPHNDFDRAIQELIAEWFICQLWKKKVCIK